MHRLHVYLLVFAACRLVRRMPDDTHKAEAFASLGMMHEAAAVAELVKDSAMLSRIQGMVPSGGTLQHHLNQLKDRLAASRS